MKYYQGEMIQFNVELDGANVSDFSYIDVYLYTSKSTTFKYTTNRDKASSTEEHLIIDSVSDTMLQGFIHSAMTSQMLGILWMEIRCVQAGMPVFVKRMQTDVEICKSTIKNENYYG